MPVFNDAEHLPSAIDRVLGQRGVEVQLVLVDDGSTDGSRGIAEEAARRDERVTALLLPANGGVAAARRRGVEAASGDWIWFVDSDDHWPDDAAACLVGAAAAANGADVVVADALLVPTSGAPRTIPAPRLPAHTGPQAVGLLLQGVVTGHLWNKLFRRSLLLGVDFPPARVQSDLALVANALAAAGTVTFCGRQVYEYRKRTGSIITSRHRRVESLAVVEQTVVDAALRAGVAPTGAELTYFRLRYIALSGMKDALSGAYDEAESRALVAAARRRIGVTGLTLLARRRDKRIALAALAYAPRRVQLHFVGRR
ncbi:hypothetical protein GCM10023225_07710 [Kineococcus glutinatus]|uniref:Glycosyltransferase 2-like domain-containing protein n=2 Tax=Kineococcus glutinatus TaxID=1070872 RepID=A0ABP9HCR2_9ACTN